MKEKKKIAFFGTPDIAVPSLKKISALDDYEVVAVGVFPDRKIGRKQVLTPCPVKACAQNLHLPIVELANKKSLENMVATTEFDLGIVIAFGMIFTPQVLAQNTFVNVHFSLLPKWRGASPVQAAILNGQSQSGITWQKMVPALDAGDILWQKKYDIQNQSTAELWQLFADETASHFPTFLNDYFASQITPQPQNEEDATFCGKFQKSDGEVCFATNTATEIWQKYLAFNPWPGIFVATPLGNVKLKEIHLQPTPNTLEVVCKNHSKIFIATAQIPGKKAQPIKDILNGNPTIFNT
ncbi:hypothetical protein CSB37_02375 [bacterium DOLZORAL124_38_8]|nr:MAG: hypothetical protein CSB37_02375 [bacterium DOLZORAL124_38_8]